MIDALAHGLNPDKRELVVGILGMFAAFFMFGMCAGLLLSRVIRQ